MHKYKKKNSDKRRSFEYTYHKKERDYFKMNNIDKSQRDLYISSAILIQSIFRGHSIKLKFYNFLYFHMCIQNGVEILEVVFYRIKKNYWKNFKNNISKIVAEKNSTSKKKHHTLPHLNLNQNSKIIFIQSLCPILTIKIYIIHIIQLMIL